LDLSSSPTLAERVAVGDVLAGKYKVERLLGKGGMGVVVAARHLQLDRLVALKLVAPNAVLDDVVVQRFEREARAAAKLRSEHVARVIDVGRLPTGSPYMVMEYLEGADLGEVLDLEGPFEVQKACDCVLQACEAVAEAHALGIVHRDLKPENLYLTTRVGGVGLIKVLDFGISKMPVSARGALTQTQAVLGSPLYMAPEQMRSSRRADARSDVWALGVVLYELLTQRWPFEADTMPDLCLKVANEPHRPVSAIRADVPPQLVAVIERCLAKDPAQRFANAGELALALEPFVAARSVDDVDRTRAALSSLTVTQSAEATTASRPRTPRRLGPVVVALVIAALVVCAGVAMVRRESSSPPVAFAAVGAALTAPSFALRGATPSADPAAATVPTASPPPAASGTSLPPRVAPLPRPARPASPPRPPEDDIPAFR
jgi:serine/threonine-protein kinase